MNEGVPRESCEHTERSNRSEREREREMNVVRGSCLKRNRKQRKTFIHFLSEDVLKYCLVDGVPRSLTTEIGGGKEGGLLRGLSTDMLTVEVRTKRN